MGTREIVVAFLVALTVLVPRTAAGQDEIRSRLIVDVDRLAALLDDPDLVLLHVGDRAEYDAEHIAGAVFVELDDISTPHPTSMSEGLILELAEPAVLKEQLERLGVSDESRIVVYYGNDWLTPSTRVVLTLQHAGFGDRTSLLDGGMQAWKRAGRPVTAEPVPERRGRIGTLHTRDLVVTADEVLERLGRKGVSIVDARAPRFYEGRYESERERPGHIAGATNIPFTEIVDESLMVKSTDALRSLFRDAGVAESDTVIAYCHIGQQATAIVFAARLIGQPVLLYDGSYTEWGRREDLPIEKAGGGRGGTATGGSVYLRPEARGALGRLAPPLLTWRAAVKESAPWPDAWR